MTNHGSDLAHIKVVVTNTYKHCAGVTGATGKTLIMFMRILALTAGVSLAAQASIHEVPLVRDRHGTFTLLATLNGTTTLAFTLDTGATNVTIPQSIAQELMRDGSLTVADYVGNAVSILADGTKRHDTLYRLRSVTIGGLTVTDVECSVGDNGSALLLGQSFLSKFGSWSVDNGRAVLVLK